MEVQGLIGLADLTISGKVDALLRGKLAQPALVVVDADGYAQAGPSGSVGRASSSIPRRLTVCV
jgi:hypothetical protein